MTVEQLRHKDVWNGEYKGFSFEIVKWSFGSVWDKKDNWNHYIYIQEWVHPELFAKLKVFAKEDGELDYYSAPCSDWDWHCGITYGAMAGNSVIKVGCDYQHYYDEGKNYSVADVYGECIKTIDSIPAN